MNKEKSSLSAAQIKKYKKLQDKAEENTQETGYFIDEFTYCYGNLAEDLIYEAKDKEWAREIYKIVEDRIGVYINGGAYLDFAGAVANELGDKKWAKKIYRNAEKSGMVENDELADEIERSLGDKEWAKKIKNG
jgi:hypothetical protein|tara:strand:- start:404 stop:805 length:402 start_codon:yes stop_codon:yes gene_type:complete